MAGADQVIANMQAWGQRLRAKFKALGDQYSSQMEAEAKVEAPWTDRTGLARQGLFGEAKEFGDDTLRVRLSHTMDYGVYLELANSGKYAILEPTVKKFAPDFFQDTERVAKGK